jgi:uncharacterized protein with HEPN domain
MRIDVIAEYFESNSAVIIQECTKNFPALMEETRKMCDILLTTDKGRLG